MNRPLLFILDFHKGELNMVYSHVMILKRIGCDVRVAYITNHGRACSPHGHLLLNALKENYLNFGQLAQRIELEDLDSYLSSINPLGVSLDIGAAAWLTSYLHSRSIPIYLRLHSFSSHPWYNSYLRFPSTSGANMHAKKLLINDPYSIKRFAWVGYKEIAITGWTCTHSSLQYPPLRYSGVQAQSDPDGLVIYSYEHREDFLPYNDWISVHLDAIRAASRCGQKIMMRTHPSQINALTEVIERSGVPIHNISHYNIFQAAGLNALHCGILTSGPVLAHLLGRSSCSVYPVRETCCYPEHMIIPGCPVDIFQELNMESLTYFDAINVDSMYELFKRAMLSAKQVGDGDKLLSSEKDRELEKTLATAYDLV